MLPMDTLDTLFETVHSDPVNKNSQLRTSGGWLLLELDTDQDLMTPD
jgi:hypothetical protein